MANPNNAVCICGAAYDSKGICTRCGRHRQRSKGYGILHGVLCVLGTLFLLCLTYRTLVMHDLIENNAVPEGLRQSRISDAQIPFYGPVKKAVLSGHTEDEKILESDVAEAIDAIGIPELLSDKTAQHFAMLRGESDKPMTISAEEIIQPLEENKEALRRSCHLIIEERDFEEIRDAFDGESKEITFFGIRIYRTKLGRAVGRFFVSIPGFLFEAAAAGLLLWRWTVIKRNCGKKKFSALKSMGLTVMIPMAVVLFGFALVAFSYLFIKGNYVGLKPFLKTVRPALWLNTGLLFAAGLLMLALSRYLTVRTAAKESAAAGVPVQSAEMPSLDLPEEPAPKTAETEGPVPVPVPVRRPVPQNLPPARSEDAPKGGAPELCIACGKPLSGKKKFCIYCGTNQMTGGNAADEIPAAPAPEDAQSSAPDEQ